MHNFDKTILVITPISHIKNVKNDLEKIGKVTIIDDPSINKIHKIIHKYDVIFTNPNKSKVFIGKKIIDKAIKLKVICTASTGTNHIDLSYARKKKIKIISLKKEKKIIDKISSTSEHAFALTLASLRNIVTGFESVLKKKWDYTNFIGRQMNFLTVGIVGYGRLGKKYANFCKAFNSKIIFYDPYKKSISKKIKKINNLNKLLSISDIISIHVHLNQNTHYMFNKHNLLKLKKNVIIVNTARGELFNEQDLIDFLKKNKKAKFATDVLENEIFGISNNKLIKYATTHKDQIIITPHIGGMTIEAQEIAYNHSVKKLALLLKKLK